MHNRLFGTDAAPPDSARAPLPQPADDVAGLRDAADGAASDRTGQPTEFELDLNLKTGGVARPA
jgi:hypothetical protein